MSIRVCDGLFHLNARNLENGFGRMCPTTSRPQIVGIVGDLLSVALGKGRLRTSDARACGLEAAVLD